MKQQKDILCVLKKPTRRTFSSLVLALILQTTTNAVAATQTQVTSQDVSSFENLKTDTAFQNAVAAIMGGSEDLTKVTTNLTPAEKADLLTYFVRIGKVSIVRALILSGINPNERNTFGFTPVFVSIDGNEVKMAKAMTGLGARLDILTPEGTPLTYAIQEGSAEMQNALVKAAPAVAQSLLVKSIHLHESKMIKSLLEAGAEVNFLDARGNTPLMEAVISNSVAATLTLLNYNATVDLVSKDKITPLGAAVLAGNTKIAKILLSADASPNQLVNGIPLLTAATLSGSTSMVKALISSGANVRTTAPGELSAAKASILLGSRPLQKLLGAKPAPPPNSSPNLTLMRFINLNDGNGVVSSLNQGADPNFKYHGQPAIFYVAEHSNTIIFQDFLDQVDNLNRIDDHGSTIFDAICHNPDPEAVYGDIFAISAEKSGLNLVKLVSKQDTQGRSAAVLLAANCNREDVLGGMQDPSGSLLKPIEDSVSKSNFATLANEADRDGLTPLTTAVLADNWELVQEFTDAGAVPDLVASGRSVYQLARANGKWAALMALPDDRVLPRGLVKGASQDKIVELQKRLNLWGYPVGVADGVLGANTLSSIRAFFINKGKEIIEGYKDKGTLRRYQHKPGEPSGNSLSLINVIYAGDPCKWQVVKWFNNAQTRKVNGSIEYIGCAQGKTAWNSDGIAYVRYADGSEAIAFTGSGGWTNDTEFSVK